MNRTLILAASLISLTSAIGWTQASVQTASATSLSPQDVRALVKTAHSDAEYRELAAYYHQQEAGYRAKAAAEKVELDRRAQVNAALYQKYPRPVDTAQSLYDSYVANANSAALQAKHFNDLATGQGQHQEQMAGQTQGRP